MVQKVNLLAVAVRDRQAFQVAEMLLKKEFGGHKPSAVEVNLAPCAKALFRGPRDHKIFEKAVATALTT